jgi:hypothetical protein
MASIRCDSWIPAQGFRPERIGCVARFYKPTVFFSRSGTPNMANHIALAQASGLPGGNVNAPLARTTDPATISANRTQACKTAPSITGFSCDEYPFATTRQGLSAGGSLRSFPGCNISAPQATGAAGASACMVPDSEQDSQGGTLATFNYEQRIVTGDDYVVQVRP